MSDENGKLMFFKYVFLEVFTFIAVGNGIIFKVPRELSMNRNIPCFISKS